MLFEGNPNRGKKDHELFFSQISWSRGIHFFHKSIHIFPLAWNLHVTRTMEHFIADLFFSVQLQKWASAINTEKEIKMGEGIDTRHQLSIGWNFELDGIDHYPYYECYTLELANSHTFLPLNLAWACSVRSAFLISCVDVVFFQNLLESSWHFSNVSNKSLLWYKFAHGQPYHLTIPFTISLSIKRKQIKDPNLPSLRLGPVHLSVTKWKATSASSQHAGYMNKCW